MRSTLWRQRSLEMSRPRLERSTQTFGRLEVRELTVDAQVSGDRLLNPLPVCDRFSEAIDGRSKPVLVQPVDRRHGLLERLAAEVPVRRATSRSRQPRGPQHEGPEATRIGGAVEHPSTQLRHLTSCTEEVGSPAGRVSAQIHPPSPGVSAAVQLIEVPMESHRRRALQEVPRPSY